MRYIALVLFFFFGFYLRVSALEILSFGVEQDSIELGESTILELQIYSSGSITSPQVEISGLDDSLVFSTSQSVIYSSINGETKQSLVFAYELEPREFGEYIFGPVTITTQSGTQSFDQETILRVGTPTVSSQSEEVRARSKNKNGGSVQGEDIRGLRHKDFPIWWFIGALIAFCLGMYLLLREFLFTDKLSDKSSETKGVENLDVFSEIVSYFQKLRQESNTLSAQAFFQKMNQAVRNIWNAEGYNIPESATLKEMQSLETLRSHPLFTKLFSESYFSEFSGRDVPIEQRDRYISIVENYLKNRSGR